jgi:hypothetical protein
MTWLAVWEFLKSDKFPALMLGLSACVVALSMWEKPNDPNP